MKRRRLFVGLMTVALLVSLCTSLVGAAPVQRYAYSASNPGGVWYTMCGGIVNGLTPQFWRISA